ncbi:MAG: hypothetical protein ACR2KP_08850 [Egibacteraceae bacterium]
MSRRGLPVHGLGELRALVTETRWRRWAAAAFLARLPTTMTLLALILVGERATGSLAVGAQLAGVATLTTGLASPWRGRLLDRGELRGGLQRACLASAAVILAQAVALATGMPVWVLFALAVAQGVAMAAIMGGFRALLVPSVSALQLPRANAFDAIFIELAFVSGPAVAAGVAWLIGPIGVLLAMAASMVAATLVARGLPPLPPAPERPALAPWRTPGALPVYLLALGVGASVGLLESAIPARLDELGSSAEAGGALLTLVAVGSAAGGIAATFLRDARGVVWRRGALLLVAMSVLLWPTAVTGAVSLLAVALLACGLPIAPLNALGALVLQDVVPPGRQAEGFAVFSAAIMFGAGAGQGATGVLLDQAGPFLPAGAAPSHAALAASTALPLLLAAAVVIVAAVRARTRRPLGVGCAPDGAP